MNTPALRTAPIWQSLFALKLDPRYHDDVREAGNSEVVVAGHICLDLIPEIPGQKARTGELLKPGTLVEVGPCVVSTGGVVSNTGVALHRLGVKTRLVGKIGNDLFGRAVLDVLRRQSPSLADGMTVSEGETTSYSVVISPPGTDRLFLHCAGANNTFGAQDVPLSAFNGARLFHFGYPPLMDRIRDRDGEELVALFRTAKSKGLTTSLDMTKPDPDSAAGRADWLAILRNVLPFVDVFLPSLEETLYMLERDRFNRLAAESGDQPVFPRVDTILLQQLSSRLLDYGAAIVGLKLGDSGIYLRTTDRQSRWSSFGACGFSDLAAWTGRELLAPCFRVAVAGTTGAGDCTIAGFLAGLLRGYGPEEAVTRAVAAGACNVEKADATSGVPSWAVLEDRIRQGWARLDPALSIAPDWVWKDSPGVWISPRDSRRKEKP